MLLAYNDSILVEWISFILNNPFEILCDSFLLENHFRLSLENFTFVPFDILSHFPDGSLEPSCSYASFSKLPHCYSCGFAKGCLFIPAFCPESLFYLSLNDRVLFSTMWFRGFLNSLMWRGFIEGIFIWP